MPYTDIIPIEFGLTLSQNQIIGFKQCDISKSPSISEVCSTYPSIREICTRRTNIDGIRATRYKILLRKIPPGEHLLLSNCF
mmetsp:Transcript_35686/g.60796  ORF Transcript_35686/g.60796 Transcript_35686/m.60796 type:complete len:82 (+) Transcript_35686:579-824(+)